MTEYKIRLDVFDLVKKFCGAEISHELRYDMKPELILTLDSSNSRLILNIEYVENS